MPNPVPPGYATVTPFLCVADAATLIEFLKQAFAAEVTFRMDRPDGAVAHAEVKIGDSKVMIGQPAPGQETQAMLHLYVPDTDAVYARAIAAGATSIREPADQFYGDRSGGVRDISGNQWWIATHIEDVAPEEMERRMAGMGAIA
jgi:PhnB protein